MMIKRIVKLSFREEAVPDFLTLFEETKNRISAFEGCHHLELLRVVNQPNILFTLSHWESEVALDNYRQSELFITTWKKTKALFAENPEAWTVEIASTTG